MLLVEDQPDTAEYMRSRLLEAGFEVGIARQGRDARAALEQRRPDVVIMDINLPEIDGDHIVEDMRRQAGLRDVPVLFLTADSVARVAHLVDGKTTIFLEKPLSSRNVISALELLLANAQGRS